MDKEPEPTSEGSLVEAYLTREEMASLILIIGLMNANPFWKLKPILESTHGVSIQPTHLLEGMKSPNHTRSRDSCITSSGSPLDDNPIPSSLDLTSDIVFVSPSNQAIDWPSIGDSSPKTTLNPQPAKIKSPTKGRKSP